jgi:DnaJ domain
MTYYEELGLSPRATEAEVKRSYKRLTLLLHPDQHQDPEIRALAETQMKRLNEIVSILADPQQRLVYDQGLLDKPLSVRHIPPEQALFWLRNNRGWILVGVAFGLFLAAAFLIPALDSARPAAKAVTEALKSTPRELAAVPTDRLPVIKPRQTTAPGSRPAQGGRAATGSLVSLWKAGLQSASGLEKPPAEGARAEVVLPLPPTLSTPPFSIPTPSFPTVPAVGSASAEASTLPGKWVYTPDPYDLQDPMVFPAEYVELTVVAAAGRLRGSYRSRYRLSDRTLSPYANFTFDGPAAGGSFVWRGDAGARGQVTLRLQSPDVLQVNWFATNMGSQLSLGSGTAKVYRFR